MHKLCFCILPAGTILFVVPSFWLVPELQKPSSWGFKPRTDFILQSLLSTNNSDLGVVLLSYLFPELQKPP